MSHPRADRPRIVITVGVEDIPTIVIQGCTHTNDKLRVLAWINEHEDLHAIVDTAIRAARSRGERSLRNALPWSELRRQLEDERRAA